MQVIQKARKNSLILAICLSFAFFGCKNSTVVDNHFQIPKNNWVQGNKIETEFVPDSTKKYHLSLRLRITSDYKYYNLFVLFKMKDSLGIETTRRYTYKIADENGQWKGKGSGNIFTYRLPLLSDYKFQKGKQLLSVEHNMRDNPLRGVTDVGIVVETTD